MGIKDVTSIARADGSLLDNALDRQPGKKEFNKPKQDARSHNDQVTVSPNVKTVEINDTRLKANETISAVNVVSDQTEKMAAVINSLEGIVTQADGKSPAVTTKLEDEGERLIREVESLIQQISASSSEPPPESTARATLEGSVGKALTLITTEKAQGHGIHKVALSNKEAIAATQSTLAETRVQFEALKSSVSQAAQTARAVSIDADIAAVKRDPSIKVIRQADEAVIVTGATRERIAADPVTAVQSIGEITGLSAHL